MARRGSDYSWKARFHNAAERLPSVLPAAIVLLPWPSAAEAGSTTTPIA